jgi:hypothetical protein
MRTAQTPFTTASTVTVERRPPTWAARARQAARNICAMPMRAPAILGLALLTSGCCDGRLELGGANMCVVVVGNDSDDTSTGSSGGLTTGEVVWGEGDCCEQYGAEFGGICLLSDFDGDPENGVPPTCYGCDWEPVLCMQQGCSTPNVADCCLNAEGQTVTCSPG